MAMNYVKYISIFKKWIKVDAKNLSGIALSSSPPARCVIFDWMMISFLKKIYLILEREWERERQRFDSCMCGDQGPTPQPWHIGTMP